MEGITKTKTIQKTITIPIRVRGRTTSITLKKSTVALWVLFIAEQEQDSFLKLKEKIVNFVYKCLDLWDGRTAKGLSDFVTEKMILELLEEGDLKKYRRILTILSD